MASTGGAVVDDLGSLHSLRAALDAGRIGTWTWDIAHDAITWSEGFEIAHGFSPGSLPRSLSAYQQLIHPEDRARVVAALQGCAAGSGPYSVAYRLIDPAGKTHHLEAHGQAVRNSNGATVGMIGVCTDITERFELLERERQARVAAETTRAQYRTLAETIPQQVWTATPEGALDFVNPRVVDYFGRDSGEIIGAGWQAVVHRDDLPRIVERWTRSLQSGEEYEVEFRLRRFDGVYRWHLGRAIPVRDDGGTIVKWLGTNTDIDDQKIAEDQLRHLNKMKDRFLSIAAHDLRTPMTGILGWTRLLHLDLDEATRKEALAWIEQSVHAQARLIEDLLDSTRIREGKLVLDRTPIDLADVVLSAFATMTPLAEKHGVDLKRPETEEVIVFGDSARLQQVIWNLLSNAIKFTPSGKQVRTFLRTDDSAAMVIVEDDGGGITPDFLPHIFEPFEQEGKGKRAGGLGLGLHIVSMIVKMHGGTIDAASGGPGKGSRFTVKLPLAEKSRG